MRLKFIISLFCLFVLFGCATWYARTTEFQTAVAQGDFVKANKMLRSDRKMEKGKNKILFYLNLGYVEFMLGHPEESNQAFDKAEVLMDEQVRSPVVQVAVLLSNPEILPYKPEDFEVIMVNFYKTMNYLQMGKMAEALVEVRKINIKLNQLNDKYPDHKNRYQRDAFAHLLMGLIYDASGDYNNAFIAYRNAYDVYLSDYKKNFSMEVPPQLKQDLMRTAYLCGFSTELRTYEQTFDEKYASQSPSEYGQLIFFWLNGLGPVKAEWGINFTTQQRGDGAIVFNNSEYGLSFPFFWGPGYSSEDKSSLADLKIVRVAFPKYMERKPEFTRGSLLCDGKSYGLEMAEDINQIAFKTLDDRMLREFGSSLLRLAAKQGVQYAASKENKWLGLAVGLANAMTEKADTRNWQTLPYSISYARVPLSAAENAVSLDFSSSKGQQNDNTIVIQGDNKKTRFYVYSTL